MKKPRKQREIFMVRRNRRAAATRRRRAALARRRRRFGLELRCKSHNTSVLPIPEVLMAEREASRSAILRVLETLMDRLAKTDFKIKLDFSQVHKIFPGGMLMLLAYLELLSENYPGRIRASCPPGSKAAQLIHHFDFGSRLRVAQAGNKPRDKSVTHWRFATGQQAEGNKIAEHIASFSELVGSSMPDGLYIVLTEAMTNVRQHAYPDSTVHVPASMQRWWLFSLCNAPTQSESGQLYIAFYDVGIGIPESMRRLLTLGERLKEGVDQVLKGLGITEGRTQDSQLLRLAVDKNRTSTGLPFRGKGLPEMKDFVMSTSGGRMTIVSGAAQYSCNASEAEPATARCEIPIAGTLILWNLPLTWKDPAP